MADHAHVIMVSVCLPSDALSQHLPSFLGFFYLGRRVSLLGCSSKAQLLLLILDEGYLLTATPPDLECGIAPLGPPVPTQPPLLGCGVVPLGQECTLLLLLLLSRFSRVRLCATPQMAAHQAPLSLGFSRQEHWSELPFPSPMHESEK